MAREHELKLNVTDAAVWTAIRYLDPDPNGAKVAKEGISGWTNPQITISWFGEIKNAGMLDASVVPGV